MIRANKEFLDYCKIDLKIGETVFFKTGEFLLRQDDYVRNLLVIADGLVKCYRTDEQGNEFVQEFFSSGQIIGEIETILDPRKETSIAQIETLSHVTCLKISCDDFQTMLSNNRIFSQLILQHLAEKVRHKALRHAFVQTHTLDENIRELRESFSPYFDMIKKKDLANYLGVTLRSLNRVLKDNR